MRKAALFLSFIISIHTLPAMSGGVQVQVDGDDGYYDDGYYDDGSGNTVIWYGPGWYWGVYFNNQNDYHNWGRNHGHWHHHGGGGGGGHHGGGGGGHHGGGGGGGGGHHGGGGGGGGGGHHGGGGGGGGHREGGGGHR
ncbi:MAG: hypothetical protein V4487_00850 [Chlamydiota bacterium]